jgi:glutamyl-tRNA reductase
MNIVVVGISHKTASVETREKFYLKEAEREILLSELKNDAAVAEALVLSTCNRSEIYAHLSEGHSPEHLIRYFLKVKKSKEWPQMQPYFYRFSGREAVCHLFRVTSGLESLVVGEQQILGQVKSAVDLARRQGMLGRPFNILSALAIRAGKKAQHETSIGGGGMSVSWAAVAMAQQYFGSLQDKSVLIIGAGKMGYLAADQIKKKDIGHIYVMNRSSENARRMVDRFSATAVSFWNIKDVLRQVDVCICSAGAPHYLLEKKLVEEVMSLRRDRKLLCLDISIPRNIEPAVSEVNNVSLVTMDDLNGVVAGGMHQRLCAVTAVEAIIEKKVKEYYHKIVKTVPAGGWDSLAALALAYEVSEGERGRCRIMR